MITLVPCHRLTRHRVSLVVLWDRVYGVMDDALEDICRIADFVSQAPVIAQRGTLGDGTMDLFTPIVSEELRHPNFRSICAQQNGYNWDVLNEWARGFKDRDGKFVYEFQSTFDTCFWELYVFAVLKQYGLTVHFSHPAPDFLVANNGGFNVEATVALHAKDATPEYMKFEEPIPQDLNEFNRRAILRIRNSIDSKSKKFAASYRNLNHVKGRPFVLAIAAFDSPHAILASQRAIEAVLFSYYVDEERYLRDGGELKGRKVESIAKNNGSPVNLGVSKKKNSSGSVP